MIELISPIIFSAKRHEDVHINSDEQLRTTCVFKLISQLAHTCSSFLWLKLSAFFAVSVVKFFCGYAVRSSAPMDSVRDFSISAWKRSTVSWVSVPSASRNHSESVTLFLP
jgi:hypothetical protein